MVLARSALTRSEAANLMASGRRGDHRGARNRGPAARPMATEATRPGMKLLRSPPSLAVLRMHAGKNTTVVARAHLKVSSAGLPVGNEARAQNPARMPGAMTSIMRAPYGVKLLDFTGKPAG